MELTQERFSAMERRMDTREGFDQTFELSAMQSGASGSVRCRARGLDISPRGIGLLTDYPLVRGMVLRLMLPVSGTGAIVPVFGEVAWVDPAGGQVRAGLRFLR